MPRIRLRGHRTRDLTPARELDLLIGGTDPTIWESEAHRREIWFRFRGEPMPAMNSCCRPSGWWSYEAPAPKLPYEKDWHCLARLGLLTPEERAELDRQVVKDDGFRRSALRGNLLPSDTTEPDPAAQRTTPHEAAPLDPEAA